MPNTHIGEVAQAPKLTTFKATHSFSEKLALKQWHVIKDTKGLQQLKLSRRLFTQRYWKGMAGVLKRRERLHMCTAPRKDLSGLDNTPAIPGAGAAAKSNTIRLKS